MDFKELNEKLESFIKEIKKQKNEAEGFALSGKKDEVNDIVQKLTQEYGDLTIPEFIDKLIQAEQKGEEILDENLNEELDWDVIFDKHDKAMAMPINNINDVIDFLNLHFGKIDTKLHFLKQRNIEAKQNDDSSIIVYIDNTSYKVNFYIDSLLGTAAVKDYEQLAVNESFDESLNENLSDNAELLNSKFSKFEKVVGGNLGTFQGTILGQPVRFGINIYGGLSSSVPSYWERLIGAGYEEQFRLGTKGTMEDELIYIPKPVISSVCHPCYFTFDKQHKDWEWHVSASRLDAYMETWTRLKFNSEKITEDEAKVWLSEYVGENALERLKKKVSHNSKTKNTTVKQALSKSAVAKKIQALKNPTPEQLARILAAIEG